MRQYRVVRLIYVLLLCSYGTLAFAQNLPPEPAHAILLGNTALVPVRAIAESAGATVTLDTAASTVTLERDATTLTLAAYDTSATSNGRSLLLPAPPLLRNGQLYVPVRTVATVFGVNIGLHGSTASDPAKSISLANQGKTTLFRAVEEARMLSADFTGSGQAETAFAVANIVGIDAYNSRYVSDIVPLEVWVVQGRRERWRASMASGVSISRFVAQDLTGDRRADLLLYFLTRHSYMGPYPGSIYRANVFHWDGRTFQSVLSLDYSRDHGRLYLEYPRPSQAARYFLIDTNWRNNEDVSHYIAELYTWNGSRFVLAKRVVTRQTITRLSTARRLLR